MRNMLNSKTVNTYYMASHTKIILVHRRMIMCVGAGYKPQQGAFLGFIDGRVLSII